MASTVSEIPVTKLLRKEIGIGGVQEGRKNTDEYRKQKGACEKCGTMMHQKQDCFEGSHSFGTKWTNYALDWDAKRNRWNECDPQTHISRLLKSTKKREQTRKLPREEKQGKISHHIAKEPTDEDMYTDDADMAECIWKRKKASKFAGENFIRYTDEIVQANEAQVVAWQPYCVKVCRIDIHEIAEPTKREVMKKEFEQQKLSAQKKIIEKVWWRREYYLHVPSKELLLAQTENYVEYNRRRKVISGEERQNSHIVLMKLVKLEMPSDAEAAVL
ncbi:Pre-mRNA-splicing factor SLU7 [Dirofilaria immitis]|nr:Pre-mRNA-splicing factor SLU7 [Dirofilaria immitis]